jgi:hypothetical protein
VKEESEPPPKEDPMCKHRSLQSSGRNAALSLVALLFGTLGLAGCGVFESSDPFSRLELEGSVTLTADGDTVLYTLSVRNPTSRDVTLTDLSGLGVVQLEVHAIPTEGGGLLWNSRDLPRNIRTTTTWPVRAGESVTSAPRKLPVSRILGDSIPPGRYEVRIRPNFEQEVPEDGLVPVELLLGES